MIKFLAMLSLCIYPALCDDKPKMVRHNKKKPVHHIQDNHLHMHDSSIGGQVSQKTKLSTDNSTSNAQFGIQIEANVEYPINLYTTNMPDHKPTDIYEIDYTSVKEDNPVNKLHKSSVNNAAPSFEGSKVSFTFDNIPIGSSTTNTMSGAISIPSKRNKQINITLAGSHKYNDNVSLSLGAGCNNDTLLDGFYVQEFAPVTCSNLGGQDMSIDLGYTGIRNEIGYGPGKKVFVMLENKANYPYSYSVGAAMHFMDSLCDPMKDNGINILSDTQKTKFNNEISSNFTYNIAEGLIGLKFQPRDNVDITMSIGGSIGTNYKVLGYAGRSIPEESSFIQHNKNIYKADGLASNIGLDKDMMDIVTNDGEQEYKFTYNPVQEVHCGVHLKMGSITLSACYDNAFKSNTLSGQYTSLRRLNNHKIEKYTYNSNNIKQSSFGLGIGFDIGNSTHLSYRVCHAKLVSGYNKVEDGENNVITDHRKSHGPCVSFNTGNGITLSLAMQKDSIENNSMPYRKAHHRYLIGKDTGSALSYSDDGLIKKDGITLTGVCVIKV